MVRSGSASARAAAARPCTRRGNRGARASRAMSRTCFPGAGLACRSPGIAPEHASKRRVTSSTVRAATPAPAGAGGRTRTSCGRWTYKLDEAAPWRPLCASATTRPARAMAGTWSWVPAPGPTRACGSRAAHAWSATCAVEPPAAGQPRPRRLRVGSTSAATKLRISTVRRAGSVTCSSSPSRQARSRRFGASCSASTSRA